MNCEEIADKYRKAIIHYSKYQNAGIIETEACFKGARIAVEQNNSLNAASFLQNVIFINLTLSEQEKIQRFDTLAELYKEIGEYKWYSKRRKLSNFLDLYNSNVLWNNQRPNSHIQKNIPVTI